jgi:hypothetical protein
MLHRSGTSATAVIYERLFTFTSGFTPQYKGALHDRQQVDMQLTKSTQVSRLCMTSTKNATSSFWVSRATRRVYIYTTVTQIYFELDTDSLEDKSPATMKLLHLSASSIMA